MDTVYAVLTDYDENLESVWTNADDAITHAETLTSEVTVTKLPLNSSGSQERIYHRDHIPTAEELKQRERDAQHRENVRAQTEFERQVAAGADFDTAAQYAELTRNQT